MVVNEPDKTETVDSVRVARARRALEVLGSVGGARKVRKLLDERAEAAGDADDTDRKIRSTDRKIWATIHRLKVDPATFFDAMDLLDGVSHRELTLAGEGP